MLLAAVNDAAGDRLADLVIVLPDWFDQVRPRVAAVGTEWMRSFANRPPVVATLLHDVDFFPQVLTDVGRPEYCRLAVEGHPPDVAESVCVNLRLRAGSLHKRVVGRDCVRLAARRVVHVD